MDSMDSDDDEYYKSYSEDDDDDDDTVEPNLKPYNILKEDQIKHLQDTAISEVTSVLSVSRPAASSLLSLNNWSLNAAYDSWISTAHHQIPNPQTPPPHACKICTEEYNRTMLSSTCGHPFCSDCWSTYIRLAIGDGPGCLRLSCPEPGCNSLVNPDIVHSLSSPADSTRYHQYLYRSFVESNPQRMKWCPGPNCDNVVEFISPDNRASYEAVCDCGYKLCFKCGDESHSPIDCQAVARWAEKNNSEAENTNWILAYTKPCPMCRKAIEKNQGCNHMTCRAPCEFQFCWLCLGPWRDHCSASCNMYVKTSKENPEEQMRKRAKNHLEMYSHYFERFDSNDKSRKRALSDLKTASKEHLERLMIMQGETKAQLKFVVDAWEQVVECRRVLKWSYAYGYYLAESGSRKLGLFGYIQGEAESALERLHGCVEKELGEYLSAGCRVEGFQGFRTRLGDLTVVTRKYFENLVRALENDLAEVVHV
ncbi:RING/U-box superfamily protein [Striga asiatica]|uniref:RBR-type E3 ubiquitin transferase n=1 Tax=Striga asiatica TaxID=4170 RepID=A0A5A7P8C7_STRAF|nr:RING/U-box superfamily protein [Striga asiatica]